MNFQYFYFLKSENKKPNMFSKFKSFENKNCFQKMKIGNENRK